MKIKLSQLSIAMPKKIKEFIQFLNVKSKQNFKYFFNEITAKRTIQFLAYLVGTVLVVLATIVPVLETYYSRFTTYLEKKPTNLETAQTKIDKIRVGYRIQAIEQIMSFTPQKLSIWSDCKEYSWVDDDYVVQVTTDLNDISYSYSLISLKEDFNLKPRFAPEIVLNKSLFTDNHNSLKSKEYTSSYRGEEGYYSEIHSNLGGTTNYTRVEFITNFNYSSQQAPINFEDESQHNLKINAITYTDYNLPAAEIFFKKTNFDCKAQQGKENVLYWEKENELGKLK